MTRSVLVCGAGGFIGSHLVKRLKAEGCWVRGVDLKRPEFADSSADDFRIGDLRDQRFVADIFDRDYAEIYQLAADMGGAGFVFTGDHDAEIMHNSASINLNILDHCRRNRVGRIFYSSSACIYPEHNQRDPNKPDCSEGSAYPANPDSEYGWEKLFSERLYLTFARNYGLEVRIGRYHNIFGPEGTWTGGREKAPAALCRKVAEAQDGTSIAIWGDGLQTRSFLFVEECIEATQRLMRSDFAGPVNIGSEERIEINDLARRIIRISGKSLSLRHISGPIGVRGRNSDNRLIAERLGWAPSKSLDAGLRSTYAWVADQVAGKARFLAAE